MINKIIIYYFNKKQVLWQQKYNNIYVDTFKF